MTTTVPPATDSSVLAPMWSTLLAAFGTERIPGLAPRLLVTDPTGWFPATGLTDGSRVPDLLSAAARRWHAAPHAATALAWKAYAYWLALPPVLSWVSARRVPLMEPADVLVHLADHRPLVTIGLRRTIRVAVLPNDPLALGGSIGGYGARPATAMPASAGNRGARFTTSPRRITPGPEIVVVPDETALLAALRHSLLDAHLAPLLEQVRRQVNLGARTLLGSLASGVAYGVIRAADALPGSTVATIGTLLAALDVADLVDLVPAPGGELTVQRKTCCLAFTLPEGKVCAGCCIRPTAPTPSR